jgi:hypothetical protein
MARRRSIGNGLRDVLWEGAMAHGACRVGAHKRVA